MKIAYVVLLITLIANGPVHGADSERSETPPRQHYETPRLVIGIMVDQMRYDYIYRFWNKYEENGIRRLVSQGFSFDNANFDYMPTFTGPGHASVYAGTTPAVHGIIGNSWYVRGKDRSIYVTEDPTVTSVGSNSDEGAMSPRWMLSSTITDELRLHNNMRSKVVALSLKDRGSILPAGHTGDAYWFDYSEAVMITSSYYHDELPDWVMQFNERDLPARFVSEPWTSLLPLESYTESIDDDNPYEGTFRGQERPTFPHDLPSFAALSGNGIVANTPFGDKYIFEMARAAIEGEGLGANEYADFLALSFSSPDHIGHRYGPTSKEVQDTYLRFDKELAIFLTYLDERIGRENYLLLLTSDHGAAHNPEYLRSLKLPFGNFNRAEASELLVRKLEDLYGFNPVESLRSHQVFLDRDLIRANNLRLEQVQWDVAQLMLEHEGVAGALTAHALMNTSFADPVRQRVQRGFSATRSGDVIYWLEPQWFTSARTIGTTHGSPYSYDTRAPLIWYGWDIPAGRSTVPVQISDIASTLANFLNVPYPSGNTGEPMNHYMVK